MDIMANGDISPCCYFYAENSFYTPTSDRLLDYWESEQLKRIQQNVLEGNRVEGCDYCYQLEESNVESPRNYACREFQDYSEEGIYDLTLRFSNLCNLSCRTCNTFCSTGWFNDAKKISSKIETTRHDLKKIYPDIQNELSQILPSLKIIHFLGGEPLMDKDHKFLVKLAQEDYPAIKIEYNTNLSIDLCLLPEITTLWKGTQNLILTLSVDGVGKQAEYLRHGLDWEIFEKNLDFIMREISHAQLYFTITVSILNIFHLTEIFEFLVNKGLMDKIKLNINPVNNPPYLNIQSLNKSTKQSVSRFYKDLGKKYVNQQRHFATVVDYMNLADKSDQLFNFFVMTKHIDRIRGESYLELFPELKSLSTK
jgi:MoaA/NifB/PqqE/SkfB family radical SAM enzyme